MGDQATKIIYPDDRFEEKREAPSKDKDGSCDEAIVVPPCGPLGEDEYRPCERRNADNLSESRASLTSSSTDNGVPSLGESNMEGVSVSLQPQDTGHSQITSTPLTGVSLDHTRMAAHLKRAFSRSHSRNEEPASSHKVTGMNEEIKVPIVGFEVMEERSKFTVFKIQVQVSTTNSWFVFRRFSDFVQLNQKLKKLFPGLRLALPPKRWFKDNFDRNFLEDRMLGLQAFADNITGHHDIKKSQPVREFFCLDEPPGPHDSLEESRAHSEELEDTVYSLKKEMADRDSEISLLTDELKLYKKQVEMLTKALRDKNASQQSLNSAGSGDRSSSGGSEADISEVRGQRYVSRNTTRNGSISSLKLTKSQSDSVTMET
ncbi:sorting nexin-16-like [Mizuhopecten yessoensis]|uniref:sorting nexin-16-like n=1 Tax=Mizuhopecten yessoensis TaxID=6573 RepID=UPI000B45EC56|nr:sorting nexin-16-like [Mizuhopecten yessoensis]XP_021365856.1 sorting nexin-16-like [Mizuhopecten yessoensis]XP_021365857.1 sorting nexin-16-like [Mizuhopecten yessoensis]